MIPSKKHNFAVFAGFALFVVSLVFGWSAQAVLPNPPSQYDDFGFSSGGGTSISEEDQAATQAALEAIDQQNSPQGKPKTALWAFLRNAGYENRADPTPIAIQVVTTLMSFLGLLFLGLTIYGGILWMSAGGNEEQVGKAKTIIRDAVIGLGLVLGAYLIAYTVAKLFSGSFGFDIGNTGQTWGDADTLW